MQYQSPSKHDNVEPRKAQAFIAMLARLGVQTGELFFDENDSPSGQSSYVPLDEADIDSYSMDVPHNVLVFNSGNYHNVAHLIRMWGKGTPQDFREVVDELFYGRDNSQALLNIPGAMKAIEKLIQKAATE